MKTSASVARDLEAANIKRVNRARATANVYAFTLGKGATFSMPFFAPTDLVATDIFNRFKSEHTELADALLYRLGSYCWLDGHLSTVKSALVKDSK